jgi:hypothetical protein
MATGVDKLETKLNDLFVKNAPKLPDGGKKALVTWLPIISAVVGVLSLWSAYTLWHWAHAVDSLSRYANNDLCNAYSVAGCGSGAAASRFSLWLWAGVILIGVEGVLYLLAFPGLRDHKKQGWNYVFYGALLNLAYAVVSLFTNYNSIGNFLGALISSAIGFYVLFQVRSAYTGAKTPSSGSEPKDSTK